MHRQERRHPGVKGSLAEDLHSVDLHPLDEFRAFQKFRKQGFGEDEIAARLFVSSATVKQRLRLTSVSPRLLDLYAEEQMKLEQVWDTVSRSYNHAAYYKRCLLTEIAIRASDRRAVFVGLDAYEAAGGIVMRDLFEQDQGVWFVLKSFYVYGSVSCLEVTLQSAKFSQTPGLGETVWPRRSINAMRVGDRILPGTRTISGISWSSSMR